MLVFCHVLLMSDIHVYVSHPHCLQRGETLVLPGPDVLTSCGRQGRLLQLQEEYVVGIGGGCNPINAWSTVGSYSISEFSLLSELAPRCGALAFFPSLTILLALTIVGTLLV